MTGAHTNRTHIVGALLQSHRELCGTRVDPGRPPTVHPCPQGEAVAGLKHALHATPQRENQGSTPRLDYQQQKNMNQMSTQEKTTFFRASLCTFSHVLPTFPDARSDSKRLNMQLFAQHLIIRVPNHACKKKANGRNTFFSVCESFLVLTVAYFLSSMHWVSSKPKIDCHFPDPDQLGRTLFDPALSTITEERERDHHIRERAGSETPPRNQNGDFSPQSFVVLCGGSPFLSISFLWLILSLNVAVAFLIISVPLLHFFRIGSAEVVVLN